MNLLRYRRLNELSLEAIAKKLKVDPSAICLIESGRRFPRPELIHKIQALSKMEVTAQDIFDNYAKINNLK